MIVSDKEVIYINALIENAVDLFHNFWPMTGFIHHNPLHGFEDMPFEEGVKKAHHYFHSNTSLSREAYQKFYAQEKILDRHLKEEIADYCKVHALSEAFYLPLLHALMTRSKDLYLFDKAFGALTSRQEHIAAMLQKDRPSMERLWEKLATRWTLYDAVDALYDTGIDRRLSEKVSRMAMRHLDEGQAPWQPMERKKGMFAAWRRLVQKDRVFFDTKKPLCRLLIDTQNPEDIIFWVMTELKIPRQLWQDYFILEFSKLHGWTGFLRWRSRSEGYLYQKEAPAFLEDFLAIRLYYVYMYLVESTETTGFFPDFNLLEEKLSEAESKLRYRFFAKKFLPGHIREMEAKLRRKRHVPVSEWEAFYARYREDEHAEFSRAAAQYLDKVVTLSGMTVTDDAICKEILANLKKFRESEGFVWQKAMEKRYLESMMYDMAAVASREAAHAKAQFLFCIDVRSEIPRRHIEANGAYETFGIAGFFGIPLKLIDVKNRHESNLCPAVVKPKNVVYKFTEKREPSKELVRAMHHIYHDLKYNAITPYLMVETIGNLFAFDFFGKTLFQNLYMPFRNRVLDEWFAGEKLIIDKFSQSEITKTIHDLQIALVREVLKEQYGVEIARKMDAAVESFLKICVSKEGLLRYDKARIAPKTDLGKAIGLMHHEEVALMQRLQEKYQISFADMQRQINKLSAVGFTFKEQLFYAENALKMVGMQSFAPVVVFCAHESTSENNPYESALNCGACGGKSSETNAKVMALILNKREIRQALQKQDITIPEETLFCYAVHNTVTDEVKIDLSIVPEPRRDEIRRIQSDLDRAAANAAAERVRMLPFSEGLSERELEKFIERNKMDWSQTRPEWGLSKNNSFIIGPRFWSEKSNFANRAFLHSYDYTIDPHGHFLEVILSGALVVGEWINLEHFFSSVDNRAFGSESKIYHNVTGMFGVISGNMSDLRTGLAAQSVHLKGEIYHEPVRLLSFIVAPFARYKNVIDRIKRVHYLVYNEWVRLVFLDPEERAFYYYCTIAKDWVRVDFATAMQTFERIEY